MLHPWSFCIDIGMPREVFNLLHKNILGESNYGLEVKEGSRSVILLFVKHRRFVVLFDKFLDCGGFEKALKGGNGHTKIIVDAEKKGSFEYVMREDSFESKTTLYKYVYATNPSPNFHFSFFLNDSYWKCSSGCNDNIITGLIQWV